MMNYVLTSVIVGLGLICGMITGIIAKEELKPGRKWLEFFQSAMLAFIVFFFMFQYTGILASAAIMVLAMLFLDRFKNKADCIIYLALSVLFYLSYSKFFVIVSAMIFLYSLPTGSLFIMKKSKLRIVLVSFGFIIISNLLFLIF